MILPAQIEHTHVVGENRILTFFGSAMRIGGDRDT